MNIPNEPPLWLSKWPNHQQLTNIFPNGVKIFYNRNQRKFKIGNIRWQESGVEVFVDRFKCRWSLNGDNWEFRCTCGMKSGLCGHNYAVGRLIYKSFVENSETEPSSEPIRQTQRVSTTKPVQRDLITSSSSSYIKAQSTESRISTKRVITVEADIKTSPGFALIRFYDDSQKERRLLKLSETYNHAVTTTIGSKRAAEWAKRDREFLIWLQTKMSRNKVTQYSKMTALKITRQEFNIWLTHWQDLQPGRFIERVSQLAINSTGGIQKSIKLIFELSEEDDRTTISAVALYPDGKSDFFYKVAKEIKKQQKAIGEKEVNYSREYLLNGSIYSIDYPLTPKTIWSIFEKKNPSMATKHICQHLPILLEERIDLLNGPAVERKSIKSTLVLKTRISGDSLIVTPQLAGKNITDSITLKRAKDRFIVTEHTNDLIDDAKHLFNQLDATEQKGNYIIKLNQNSLTNIVRKWDILNPKIKIEADEATKLLLNPTVMAPSLNAIATGRWIDLFTSWHTENDSVLAESINLAVENKYSFLRSREGHWIRLDLEAIIESAEKLEECGLTFSVQRHVPSEAIRILDSEKMEPFLNSGVIEVINDIKRTIREEYPLASRMEPILRPYQLDGFKFLQQMDMYQIGCILADDMGLGKTVQALALLLSTKDLNNKTSIVCTPASVMNVWYTESLKFAPSLRVAIAHGNSDQRQKIFRNIESYDLIITSYGSIRNDAATLNETPLDFLILDEAQAIRNPSTKTYKAVCSLRVRQKIAITGTPVENRATDLWSIVNFLNPGFLGTLDQFKAAYDANADKEVRKQLAARISPLLLRRTKELVAKELPPKTVEPIVVEMHKEQRDAYRDYLSDFTDLYKSDDKNKIKMLAMLTRLRQISCSPELLGIQAKSAKLDCMLEMIEEIVDEGHSILVFSSFTSMLQIIEDRLEEKKLSWRKITGQTPVNKRTKLVDEFNNSEDPEIFLLSLKAAGTGLTLTKADYVFIYDPWWNPASENQAIDRTHRIGQDKPVIAYKMVSQGTIEEEIIKLQVKKQELFNDLVANNDTVPESISTELLATMMEQTENPPQK